MPAGYWRALSGTPPAALVRVEFLCNGCTPCHPERSEGSRHRRDVTNVQESLRCAQNDSSRLIAENKRARGVPGKGGQREEPSYVTPN